ncbi:hypothetical protein PPSIR1_42321 [Plesiocystis pacifica SIR-1]|uniref:Uncharacterized protein n=1 Tax=Plesiocystis pacifica SIR-1 TaxID=391625 RepID=A6GD20_9BACT|nr:hypothetical protein PPSIR1_42321 [Plesiocystis pacifica SIR-1]
MSEAGFLRRTRKGLQLVMSLFRARLAKESGI